MKSAIKGQNIFTKGLVPGNGDISELLLRLPDYSLWYQKADCLVRKSENNLHQGD